LHPHQLGPPTQLVVQQQLEPPPQLPPKLLNGPRCLSCGATDTPKWRCGMTLCNACGLRQAKKLAGMEGGNHPAGGQASQLAILAGVGSEEDQMEARQVCRRRLRKQIWERAEEPEGLAQKPSPGGYGACAGSAFGPPQTSSLASGTALPAASNPVAASSDSGEVHQGPTPSSEAGGEPALAVVSPHEAAACSSVAAVPQFPTQVAVSCMPYPAESPSPAAAAAMPCPNPDQPAPSTVGMHYPTPADSPTAALHAAQHAQQLAQAQQVAAEQAMQAQQQLMQQQQQQQFMWMQQQHVLQQQHGLSQGLAEPQQPQHQHGNPKREIGVVGFAPAAAMAFPVAQAFLLQPQPQPSS